MTVRRRILLAALAVGVVGTLVVLIWSAGPKDGAPKVELALYVSTNSSGKLLGFKITNRCRHAVTVTGYEIVFEDSEAVPGPVFRLRNFSIAPDGSRIIMAPVGIFPHYGGTRARWRFRCDVQRETWSVRLRLKLQTAPFIGPHIRPPAQYQITSDWFT